MHACRRRIEYWQPETGELASAEHDKCVYVLQAWHPSCMVCTFLHSTPLHAPFIVPLFVDMQCAAAWHAQASTLDHEKPSLALHGGRGNASIIPLNTHTIVLWWYVVPEQETWQP